ncbi:MAG: D-tyrosyl-tRNA(Tyr) deacylase [Ruminococcaceae bacterium]|nr:D-tyrosyl-tRNA(Tyr) deacylase [Oscillospiraceae bacterium]
MKVVFQRVSRASVTADGVLAGSIGRGMLLLVGIGPDDTEEDAVLLAKKAVGLRVYEDENGRMNRSIEEIGGDILAVSNFTLYGDCRRGRRPDFTGACAPARAKELYEAFLAALRELLPGCVQSGVFGADMRITMVADGPVTLLLDSEQLKAPRRGGDQ